MDVREEELQGLYQWVDEIPLSRPKRNIARDFSDGVLMAEVIAHYYPRYVELHNYSPANALSQKLYNWNTLNLKPFKRLGFSVSRDDCEAAASCVPGAIEKVLKLAKIKIAKHGTAAANQCSDSPSGSPRVASARAHTPARQQQQQQQQQQQPQQQQQQPQQQQLQQQQQQQPGQEEGEDDVGFEYQQQGVANAAPSTSTRDRADAPAGVMSTPRSPKSPRRHSDPHPSHETTKALLASKDALIKELRDINEILEAKVRKLEQLVRLKELKVQTLSAKLKLHEQPPEQQLPPQQPNWSQNEGMFDVDTARGYAEANMEQLAL